ncbi:uncharacterized protein LOC121870820 [Homarus americanus]|uniref:uncharacterized protein LOC121870820 n=1 Tax=Homarus americanus TaxID=6706 RepID=UPI001C4545ED|nr:uncharacterized protein LOC121870820 [Homarus americanus]
MENDWWVKKAQEIQAFADVNNTHGFYEAVKSIYGLHRRNVTPIRSLDGTTLYKSNQMIAHWITSHPCRPCTSYDEAPLLQEVEIAIRGLSNNKSAGSDGIPAEIYKHGAPHLTKRLHSFLLTIWATKSIPQDWKDANIITINKNKGDKAICGNSRGISILVVAGKILSKIMLSRLIQHLMENTLPEFQCGIRKDRSIIDMIFTARLI